MPRALLPGLVLLLCGPWACVGATDGVVDSQDPGSATNGLSLYVGLGGGETDDEGHVWIDELVLSELVIRVDQVVLNAQGPNGPVSIAHARRPVVNLVSGTGTQAVESVADIELRTGRYTDFELELHLGPRGPNPALECRGTIDLLSFELTVDQPIAPVGFTDSFEMSGGLDTEVSIVFHPEQWFRSVDLAAATITADGVALINATDNADLYWSIVDDLLSSTTSHFPGSSNN